MFITIKVAWRKNHDEKIFSVAVVTIGAKGSWRYQRTPTQGMTARKIQINTQPIDRLLWTNGTTWSINMTEAIDHLCHCQTNRESFNNNDVTDQRRLQWSFPLTQFNGRNWSEWRSTRLRPLSRDFGSRLVFNGEFFVESSRSVQLSDWNAVISIDFCTHILVPIITPHRRARDAIRRRRYRVTRSA